MKRLTADQARELMNEELSQARFEEIMDEVYYQIGELAKKGVPYVTLSQPRYKQVRDALIEDGYDVQEDHYHVRVPLNYIVSWRQD